ncbi:transcriptional regulator [Tardiphaga robiniae]|uniref:Transcriptional regulator n=1 Tax=Tardiphaga robiniae TaxID=943830 RepID=A0A7G6TVP0_9BRAD|nr:transcriptional regulator [Tardiphaga robiniae]QND70822.1 transcriptional regulator [Tardiphaga robiniae]
MVEQSQPRYAFAVGHSAKLDPYLQDYVDLLAEINKESDRGAVLTAASFIDVLLQKTIAAFMVDDGSAKKLCEGFNAPIGTLSSRILAAFALGLISTGERAECDTIRKIRNEFAHNVKVNFNDQKLTAMCSNLKFATDEQEITSQMRFTSSAVTIITRLVNRPIYVAKAKLKYQEWPTAASRQEKDES